MKILTVCEGGNVRSVTMAYLLKNKGHEALPMGVLFNSQDTHNMLFDWADKIIVVEERLKEPIPEEYLDKVVVCEIGGDRWGQSLHPDLQKVCSEKLAEAGL